MLLSQIKLSYFRNFQKKIFEVSPFLTIVIGENARGKTNLLEGVYFLINGIGFRETREEELLNFDKKADTYASVEGNFSDDDGNHNFAVTFNHQGQNIVKSFLVNKTKKRHADYIVNQTKTVLFSPEQIEIITGAPQLRREYLNILLSFYDPEYKKRLKNYESAIRKRNKILETFTSYQKLQEELRFWNTYLIEQGKYLSEKREEYLNFLNEHNKIDHREFRVTYLKNEISKPRIEQYFEKEIRVRRTLIGPQKDDFEIVLDTKNVHLFGARSEQRLAILWLKMNEAFFYEDKFKKKPMLLLDDIFSELDQKNKHLVLDLVKKYQTIATTTEEDVLKFIDVPQVLIRL